MRTLQTTPNSTGRGQLGILAVALALGGGCTHLRYGFATNPTPNTPDALAAGQALYQTHCASCHGNTGKGDGPQASGLPAPATALATAHQEWSDGVFHIRMISRAKNGMPSFKDTLTEEQRWQIIRYVRSIE
jgi:mono/diheme cytochrome c family protein